MWFRQTHGPQEDKLRYKESSGEVVSRLFVKNISMIMTIIILTTPPLTSFNTVLAILRSDSVLSALDFQTSTTLTKQVDSRNSEDVASNIALLERFPVVILGSGVDSLNSRFSEPPCIKAAMSPFLRYQEQTFDRVRDGMVSYNDIDFKTIIGKQRYLRGEDQFLGSWLSELWEVIIHVKMMMMNSRTICCRFPLSASRSFNELLGKKQSPSSESKRLLGHHDRSLTV